MCLLNGSILQGSWKIPVGFQCLSVKSHSELCAWWSPFLTFEVYHPTLLRRQFSHPENYNPSLASHAKLSLSIGVHWHRTSEYSVFTIMTNLIRPKALQVVLLHTLPKFPSLFIWSSHSYSNDHERLFVPSCFYICMSSECTCFIWMCLGLNKISTWWIRGNGTTCCFLLLTPHRVPRSYKQ